MIRGEPVVDSPPEAPVVVPSVRRERVVVRRRRPHGRHRSRTWTARASRRKGIRVALICVGALIMMAFGLYMMLARQDAAAPVEGLRHTPSVPTSGAAVRAHT